MELFNTMIGVCSLADGWWHGCTKSHGSSHWGSEHAAAELFFNKAARIVERPYTHSSKVSQRAVC